MPGNWLDSTIGWISPRAGARRVKARLNLHEVRAYAGAALGRNTDGWRSNATSADAEIAVAGQKLRERSRDLVRNNPHAAKAVSILTNNIVGEGIMPRPKTGDVGRDNAVKAAFEEWLNLCDADGQLDFYGLQTLAVREMVEGGEVLARRRWRLPKDNLPVPVQIQLLEADFLDDTKNGRVANGNSAVSGIEFNLFGQRTAYWLYGAHPGNSFGALASSGVLSSGVPASEIAHIYEKQRTQCRGVPWASPVIRRIRDIDDYDFAEGIRKKIEASTVAFVTSEDEADDGIAPKVVDARGNLVEKFQPGLIAYMRGGKDIKFNSPASIGGYEDYKRVSAREIAAGLRVPYELLTGDLSSVNFSSARVGIIEFRRFCSVMQWQVVIPMLLDPWWRWFCEAAFLAGKIDAPFIPVEWSPPKWQAIEPYKDAMADLITLRIGTRSWADVVAERGRNPDEVLAEIQDFNIKIDDKKITLDSDPRKTTMKGLLQKLLPGEDGEPLQDGTGEDNGDGPQD